MTSDRFNYVNRYVLIFWRLLRCVRKTHFPYLHLSHTFFLPPVTLKHMCLKTILKFTEQHTTSAQKTHTTSRMEENKTAKEVNGFLFVVSAQVAGPSRDSEL